mmetsp:Transcript_11123/g.26397  ORF Transcript_11123/g.26397 Transcript_11123/m.26397 type:complete len:218 (+) Transcript_11123:367-1020(+)
MTRNSPAAALMKCFMRPLELDVPMSVAPSSTDTSVSPAVTTGSTKVGSGAVRSGHHGRPPDTSDGSFAAKRFCSEKKKVPNRKTCERLMGSIIRGAVGLVLWRAKSSLVSRANACCAALSPWYSPGYFCLSRSTSGWIACIVTLVFSIQTIRGKIAALAPRVTPGIVADQGISRNSVVRHMPLMRSPVSHQLLPMATACAAASAPPTASTTAEAKAT